MQLITALWQSIKQYIAEHSIKVHFGDNFLAIVKDSTFRRMNVFNGILTTHVEINWVHCYTLTAF